MTNIQPSTILGNFYNDISAFCKEKQEAMFITKDGRNDLAVMSMEMYEALSKQELYRLLDEGRAAAVAGRKRPWRDAMSDIRQKVNDGSL
ncbi:MAG: prevent-host-death protein [Oscillospiraceae bacterium]|nr:prevent-host-death protein [Oscillospiraceae bacterium]